MRILLALLLFLQTLPLLAQLQFMERMEVPSQNYDPIFELLRVPSGLVAFRTIQPRSLDADRVVEYFLTNNQLESQGLVEVKIKKGYDMVGYDSEGDNLYILFAKGETSAAEKYILHLDLVTQIGTEYNAANLLPMDLVEFLVLEQRAIFLGVSDSRQVVQVFSLEDRTVHTVQGIYGNDSYVVQLVKQSEMQAFEVVLRRRGPYKSQETLLLTFDLQGLLLREIKLAPLGGQDDEPLDGLLLSSSGYDRIRMGAYGKESRNYYKGAYLLTINAFGEQNSRLFTLEDFPNFFNYLPEKQRDRQLAYVKDQLEKGKVPSIRNAYSIRDVKELEDRFLVYFDQYSVSSTRGSGRVAPPLASQRYRYDRGSRMGYIPFYMDPNNPFSSTQQAYTLVTEYTYRSAHFIEITKAGQVIWDNAANYEDISTNSPEAFAEMSVQGEDLFHVYLVNDQIKLNYFKSGKRLLDNETIPLALDPSQGTVQDTELPSLRLLPWYGPYFLVSGIQKIKSVGENGKNEIREVFFIHKLLLDGELYVPNEDAD